MVETLRTNTLPVQRAEDWKEIVPCTLSLGFTCPVRLGLASAASARPWKRLPFPDHGKASPCPSTCQKMKYTKMFRPTWWNETCGGVSCRRPESWRGPRGSSSWHAGAHIAHAAKIDQTNTRIQLCIWMEDTVFTFLQGWLITQFASSNHLSFISLRWYCNCSIVIFREKYSKENWFRKQCN